MRPYKTVAILIVLFTLYGCSGPPLAQPMPVYTNTPAPSLSLDETKSTTPSPTPRIINTLGNTLMSRFSTPVNTARVPAEKNSFASYLRALPLKAHGEPVLYFDGTEKPPGAYLAVVDMPIGTRDLQQCADSVIRLRAEYLYSRKAYDSIAFEFTNGWLCEYSRWRKGYRVKVENNKCAWVKSAEPDESYASFRKYLDTVFTYAGTRSLAHEMTDVDLSDMEIGDVFVVGGSPGHAVIVADMAIDESTGQKYFMLLQGYMPAQDIQVLTVPGKESPWYPLNFGDELVTPEWTFSAGDLKRFAR